MTFTPYVSHKITALDLALYRVGLIGTITISIKPTVNNEPNGQDLCVGTVEGSTLYEFPENYGSYTRITFTPGAQLCAGTMYAIVLHATGINDPDNLLFGTQYGYDRGAFWGSQDGGLTWFDASGDQLDIVFAEYGQN